jgi:uncharacterized membrane protein
VVAVSVGVYFIGILLTVPLRLIAVLVRFMLLAMLLKRPIADMGTLRQVSQLYTGECFVSWTSRYKSSFGSFARLGV